MSRTIPELAWRIAVALAVASLAAPAAADDLTDALAAIDYGNDAAARAPLAARAAEASFWQAVAERGEARKAAAERAIAGATDAVAWIRSAGRALIASADGDHAVAAAAWREALAASANEGRLWKLLGDELDAQGDGAGAQDAYERAVALHPGHPTANLALGDLRRESGDFGGAFNAYNHAIDARGEPVTGWISRAAAKLYLGDAEGAVADLEEASRRAPNGPLRYRALMGVVYVRAYQRQLPTGLDRAEQAVRMWQELGRADMVAATSNATGRVLLETGDAEGGARWYERGWQAIEASSMPAADRTIWRVRSLHGLARAAAARRDLGTARQLAAEAAQLMAGDAANAEHYGWIGPYLEGYLLLAERRPEAALVELQRSEVERPYIAYLIAEAHARSRNRDEARPWYERALAASTGLDPESVIVRPLATAWLAKNR
jgi:tetratricopeptide (TPR) repeat protein